MNNSVMGFNGERRDSVSGTTHLGNGYRAYNPVLMHFTCPDSASPFGAGGINPYAYCASDPINRADPSGHWSLGQWVGMAVGLTAGIALGIVTSGAAMPAVLNLVATLAAGAAIGAGSELVTEVVDGQRVNWGMLGITAGIGAAAELTGFAMGRVNKLLKGITSGKADTIGGINCGSRYINMGLDDLSILGTSGLRKLDAGLAFSDWGEAGRYLRVFAHGTAGRVTIDDTFLNGLQLSTLLTMRVPKLKEYEFIDLIICNSADVRETAFRIEKPLAQVVAETLQMPVQGYHGLVFSTFSHLDGDMAYEYALKSNHELYNLGENNAEHFSELLQRHNPHARFSVTEKNPFNPLTEPKEYKKFSYLPRMFFPLGY